MQEPPPVAAGRRRRVSLPWRLEEDSGQIEFRVYWPGTTDLAVSSIRVSKARRGLD